MLMMENERKNKTFYRIMKIKTNNINEIIKKNNHSNKKNNISKLLKSTKNNISKKINDISLQNIDNREREKFNLTDKKKTFSKSFSKFKTDYHKLLYILKTPDIMNRAEIESIYIKNALIDSEKKYLINKKKFLKIRKKTDEINKFFISLRYKEKKEKNKNNNTNKSYISQDSEKEIKNIKLLTLLNDNPLLLKKKKDIESYYAHKDKSQVLKDNNKIRYMNKIKEYLELLKIKHNKRLDNKEKISKIKQTKYIINYQNRLDQEYLKNTKKLIEQIKKEKEKTLKNIKETNSTLNTINNNKSFLDDEIKLKYNISYNCNINTKENISKNQSNKLIEDKDRDKIEDKVDNNSYITNNFHILRLNKLEKHLNKKYNMSKSYISLNKKNNLNLLSDNDYFESDDYKSKAKSKIESLYDEIKFNYILNKKNRDFVEDYFKKKKFVLNNKPYQVVSIVNNSLNNINYVNLEKKTRKMYGLDLPKNIMKYIEHLEKINKNVNQIKKKVIHSLCKSRIDSHHKKNN